MQRLTQPDHIVERNAVQVSGGVDVRAVFLMTELARTVE